MSKYVDIPEKFLYEIWKEQNFTDMLTDETGEQISILDAGQENKDKEGPDFLNARIRIGNITYQGDIEIDPFQIDWKNHGHHINKKYNKVILHIYLNSNTRIDFVHSQNGRKIPSIGIKDYLKVDLRTTIQKAILSERKSHKIKMPCSESSSAVNDSDKVDYLYDLGLERFKGKCKKLLERLKELSYLKEQNLKEPIIKYQLDEKYYNKVFTPENFLDQEIWYELIYEFVFEALGYSMNKDIMIKLSRSIDLGLVKKISQKQDKIVQLESIFFNVSGLLNPSIVPLDEESSIYIKKLTEYWMENKYIYDGRMYKDTQWKYAGLRPPNFPALRLAGGIRILNRVIYENLMGNIISEFNKENDLKRIITMLRRYLTVKATDYWHNHYSFTAKAEMDFNYIVGVARADEIIINVILPVCAIYFQLFDKMPLFNKVMKVYSNFYQNTENSLVFDISKGLKLNDAWKRSILYQGMIELFRSYCSSNKCIECTIGKKAFEIQD